MREEAELMKRAKHFIKQGDLRRAMQVIERGNTGVADARRPAVQQALKRLIPERKVHDFKAPPPSAGVPPTLDKVYRALLRKARGSAPGPSGVTAEHILAVWPHKLCRAALCAWFN